MAENDKNYPKNKAEEPFREEMRFVYAGPVMMQTYAGPAPSVINSMSMMQMMQQAQQMQQMQQMQQAPAPQPTETRERVGFCPTCGAALYEKAAFCMECGTKLTWEE